MGLLGRLFATRDREPDVAGEALDAGSPAAPDWVPRDVEEGLVKVRLYLSPAGSLASLYELDLPEGKGSSGGRLRCFSPPLEAGGAAEGTPRRAWTVEVGPDELGELAGLAAEISIFPAGKPASSEEPATVDLSLASGQAEARLRWWLNPPGEWERADRFVARIRELAERGG